MDTLKSKKLAIQARLDVLDMIHSANSSHIGSAYSVIDILSVLYSYFLNLNVNNVDSKNRNHIILSKGHAGAALYAILAELGFYDKEMLKTTYYKDGSTFSGHISHKGNLGIEFSTGSLGQGASVACGIALAGKIDRNDAYTYAIVGDGETEEGSIWEMAGFASKNQLSNFILIVDHNKQQCMGDCNNVIDFTYFSDKWKAFGWNVVNVDDGNDHDQLYSAFSVKSQNGKPTVIIANTIKGKGVSYMENQLLWHYRAPQNDFYDIALKELRQIEMELNK